MTQNVIEVLEKRGCIDSLTSAQLTKICQQSIGVYIGFDPTAESLHLGNFVGIVMLGWFQKFGHKPVALAGGATGCIGDPTGKNTDRPYLDKKTLENNLKGIRGDLERILSFDKKNPVLMRNNYDWYKNLSFLDFLRDVAGHFRLGPMLSRETVKERLKTQEGMSIKEFCYPMLQAYDFLHLFQEDQVMLQLGGSDQWTNITAGVDLVRKTTQQEVYGLTFPLLTKSDGKKFGKSEQGAIWLNKEKLSPYDFYQYLYRTHDQDVIKMLKMLTYLDLPDIFAIESAMKQPDCEVNYAQKILAKEVTKLVHGEDDVRIALEVTEKMRPGADTILTVENLKHMADELPHLIVEKELVLNQNILDILVCTNLLPSKGEVKRLIQNGGLYINNERVVDEKLVIKNEHIIESECLLIALGKKKKVVIFIKK